jgi:phosphatidate cytidylyltransferase
MSGWLPEPVFWVLAGVFGLLATASLAVRAPVLSRGAAVREIRRRTETWWMLVLLFAAALLAGRTGVLVLTGFLCVFALREYLALIAGQPVPRGVLLWAYLTIPVQLIWVATNFYSAFIVYIPIYVFAFLPLHMLRGQTQGYMAAVATLFWGLMATVYSLSHLAYLAVLPGAANADDGLQLVFFLVFLAQLNDVAQYAAGKLIGGAKIAPRISPSKTWAGFAGGLITTAGFAVLLAPALTPFGSGPALAAGVLIAAAGFAGDLVLSALKRDAGVKDSGTLLPGHGGILDRVDSLVLSAPLFFHFCRTLYFS